MQLNDMYTGITNVTVLPCHWCYFCYAIAMYRKEVPSYTLQLHNRSSSISGTARNKHFTDHSIHSYTSARYTACTPSDKYAKCL